MIPNCEVIDITFKGGRNQSQVAVELGVTPKVEKEAQVPSSLTPEQLKNYCLATIKLTDSQSKRRVYAHFYRMVEENEKLKQELRKYKLKDLRDQSQQDTPDDIQE